MPYIEVADWSWGGSPGVAGAHIFSSDTGSPSTSTVLLLNEESLTETPSTLESWLSVMVAGDTVRLLAQGSTTEWTWDLSGPPVLASGVWSLPLALPPAGGGALPPGTLCSNVFLFAAPPAPPIPPPSGPNPLTEAREAAVAALELAIPGVSVYPAPPEVVSTPCAIVTGQSPWLGQRTFSQVEVLLEVNVGVTVTGLNREAYSNLEQALWDARTALDAIGITGPIAPPAVQKFGQADVALCSFNVRVLVST